jgi:GNAT superfamily N-acetyltransferase
VSATIRTAGPADVPAIAAMRAAWTEEYAGEPIEDDAFLDAFAAWFERESDQRVTWLAEDGGDPVGMLNMLVFTRMPRPRRPEEDRPSQWGYIANVFVDATRRDAGVGRQLLDAATAYAVDHRFARIVLSPSERSVPFYSRAGFVPATSLLIREL